MATALFMILMILLIGCLICLISRADIFLYFVLLAVIVGAIVFFVFLGIKKKRKKLNETKEDLKRKLCFDPSENIEQSGADNNTVSETSVLRQAADEDIFEIVLDDENRSALYLKDDKGTVLEFKQLASMVYGTTPEDETYIVLGVQDEEGLYILRVLRNEDDNTFALSEADKDTLTRVYNDYNSRTLKSDRFICIDKTRCLGTEEERRGRQAFSERKQARVLPDLGWFEGCGMPVKEVPIDKKTLKQFDDYEKKVIAIASYPLVMRSMIIIPLLFVIGLLAILVSWFAGGEKDGGMYALIALAVVFLGGSFLVQKWVKRMEGFEILEGRKLILMPIGFRILYRIAYPLGLIWGFFSNFIYNYILNMERRGKMTGMPRVGMPQNCGFDEFIEVYSQYEAECSMSDAWDQSMAHTEKIRMEDIRKEAKAAKKEVASSDEYSYDEKERLTRDYNKIIENSEKIEKEKIDPRL